MLFSKQMYFTLRMLFFLSDIHIETQEPPTVTGRKYKGNRRKYILFELIRLLL